MNDVIENKKTEAPEQPVEVELASGITTTKPDHSKARACVFVDGLSLLGFNPTEDRAEFGFFKDMHYPVTMNIYNRDCKLIWSTENSLNFSAESTMGAVITINASKKGMGQRYQKEPWTDVEDFRNLPSLPEWHGVSKLEVIPDTDDAFISARLNIKDAIFYTHKMSVNEARRSVSGVSGQTSLGAIGRIPGADIFCAPTEKLEIEIKPLNVKDSIKISLDENNSPYTIFVQVKINDAGHHTSHLVHLYSVLKKPTDDNRTFALKFETAEPDFSVCGGSLTAAEKELAGKEKGFASNQFECQVFVDSEGGW